MERISSDNKDDTERLVARAAQGDSEALSALMERFRQRLKRLVGLRMDRRLQGRVGASDVVQEAMIEAARRFDEYATNPPASFYLWLRWLTADKIIDTHRRHLGTQMRDASREISLYRRPMPEACSVSLAQQLLGQITSPTNAVARAELQLVVQEVLNSMDSVDREIIVLQHFEELTIRETAKVLGIKRSTASMRYIAALKRLKQALTAVPGFDEDERAN